MFSTSMTVMFTIPMPTFQSLGVVDLLWHLVRWLGGHSYAWTVDIIKRWKGKPELGAGESIFALIIGIDKHLHDGPIIKNLSGCVADADDIITFLCDTLDVPRRNITSIQNEEATAARITEELKLFATDTSIDKGSNIFIFFAGHGIDALPPEGWASDTKILTLVPYDFDPRSHVTASFDTLTPEQCQSRPRQITLRDTVDRNGITLITLGQLLENIANEKGNNITVICDCCHAGSGTRHSTTASQSFPNRASADFAVGITGRLDAGKPPSSRGAGVLERHRNKGSASHVFLAACTGSQGASEVCGRGAFTSALTTLLRNTNLKKLTYSDIVRRLPNLGYQNPQCDGTNRGRIFLHNYTPCPRRPLYRVVEKKDGLYVIDAGEAHGITVDAEFVVYDSESCDNELGHLVVKSTTAFQSSVRHVESAWAFDTLPENAFAVQTRIGITQDVRFFVESDDALVDVFAAVEEEMLATSASEPRLKVVASREEDPDLVVTASGGVAHFEITDQICRDAKLYEIPYWPATDIESMRKILRVAVDFYWNLRNTTTDRHISRSRIGIECYELSVNSDDDIIPDMYYPVGKNLVVDGVIDIGINDSEEKCYGFRINNFTTAPLFVSAFYFNMSDLSIGSYYQPTSAGNKGHVASLPGNSFLDIGYGSSRARPYTFYLDKGDVDVGYIKFYLSTEYVDYSSIAQVSAFDQQRPSHVRAAKFPELLVWDTISIPILQHRIGPEDLDHCPQVYSLSSPRL